MNLPNKLTVLRMILTPVFMAVILAQSLPHRFLWAAIIFTVAAITDTLDGRIARKNKQITDVGKLLDPVADKMLTTAALLAFIQLGWCNIWIVMIILTREFLITSIRLIATAKGVVIPANIYGKLKTASQMAFTIAIMVFACFMDFSILPTDFNLPLVSNVLLWITAALTVISGVIYMYESRELIVTK